MKTVKVKLYEFKELSDEAKAKVLDKYRNFNTDDSYWYESVYEDAKEIGKIIGIDIDKIYFSGFYSQGDGACFEGNYQYRKNSVKLLKEYAPLDKELHRIAESLYQEQKRNFYRISATIKHSGHYYHKNSTEIDFNDIRSDNVYAPLSTYDYIRTLLRDFMQWIYKTLEKECEYQESDEAIIESLEANEYKFLSSGISANCIDN